MSEETNPVNPADLYLPNDYEDDLEYRTPKPILNSTDTSEDEDKNNSGQNSPITPNTVETTYPKDFKLLDKLVEMAKTGSGPNSQQLGEQSNPVAVGTNLYEIADQLANLKLDPQGANYLAPDDIVKKYKELEVQYHKDKINNGKIICTILDYVKTLKDPPKEFDQFVEDIKKDTKQVTELCDSQEPSLSKAKEISEIYSQPIEYPTFRKPDASVNQTQLSYARSAKEIVAAVGTFDPSDKNHDFTQTWQVLLRYGKSNFFEEKDYIDALFHISRGDAKTILIEFDRLSKSLRQILEHFASIYSVKRSLVTDRRAVENFTRKKGELLEATMHRYDIVLDKIRHLHSEQAWPELSRNMKKVKLMQVIADETRIYIQNEEDDAIEATGMPYEFDKLVRLASKYERQHNKLPGENIQTVFETSNSVPKNKKKQEDFIKQIVHEVLISPVMARDQSPKAVRDSSRDRLETFRSEQRKDKFNKNRPLSQEIFSPTQSDSPLPSKMQLSSPPIQPSPPKPNPFQKSAEDRSAFLRAINRPSSMERSHAPFSSRGRDREKRRERENSLTRQQSRSPSLDRSHSQNENSQSYLPTFSQSYITPGQKPSESKERLRSNRDDSHTRRHYDSGAERIRSQDKHFNAKYTSHRESHPYRNHSPYNPNYQQRRYSHDRSYYHRDRNASNDRHARSNSPYHNSGRNRSPSPYAFPQRRNSSYDRRQLTISEKAPKEILIRVSTQDLQTENR
jgi:hypothetical protein